MFTTTIFDIKCITQTIYKTKVTPESSKNIMTIKVSLTA